MLKVFGIVFCCSICYDLNNELQFTKCQILCNICFFFIPFNKQKRKNSSKGYTLLIYIIKREQERETPEDLKQAFRVFDKVSIFSKPITYDNAIQA